MENYKNIRAITFDFWGVFATIDPPMNHYLKERNISLEKHSKEIHDLIVLHDLGKINEIQFLQECSRILGVEIPYEQCKYVYKKGSLNERLIDIVKKLREKYKIALLTNNNRDYVQEFINKPGLNELFDVEVISYEAGYRKPDPEIYKILVQKLNFKPEEILYLDDEQNKLIEAEKQGFKTLIYKSGETDRILESLV